MSEGPFTGDPIQDMFTLRDRYGMYQDEEYDVKFVKSGLSNLISGDVFEGTFELGVRWGVGVTTFADGRLEVARYIAGENDRKETAFFSSNRRSA